MSDPRTRTAVLLLSLVAILFTWWGWKQGAYFGSVFYPGALTVFLLLGLLLTMAPFAGRIHGAALVALLALVGLSLLELLSALWSPTPAAAIKYAWHDFFYVVVFLVGAWVTHLLRRRMALASLPVVFAGAVVAVGTVAVLASGHDVEWYLHMDATLRFPIGYRNAAAAFFMICLWPLLALVAGEWDWRLRALLVPIGTILFELTILSQSRGSVPAAALALLVFLALSRDRLRAAVAIGLVVIPALPALPTLLEVYRHGDFDAAVLPLLRDSAEAIGVTALLSLLAASLAFGALAPRLRLPAETRASLARALGALGLVAVLVLGASFVLRDGGPVGFIDQRVAEFEGGSADLSDQSVRYGANVGSNRGDFWRVARDEGRDQPLLGGGGGSFQLAYLQHRRSGESPEDPHSVEALMFSELGLPGLVLLLTFVGAATVAALRASRLGPAAAALVAGGLAAAAQWFAQASYDWLWNYPGVTAPAIFLLGAAAAPGLLDPGARYRGRLRAAGVATLLGLTLLCAPLLLSARYLERGHDETDGDPHVAIADFDSAARLNPFDAEPLIYKATIEARLDEREVALRTLREALDRQPDSYLAHYLTASLLRESDGAAALAALQRAEELNPKDRAITALRRELGPGEG